LRLYYILKRIEGFYFVMDISIGYSVKLSCLERTFPLCKEQLIKKASILKRLWKKDGIYSLHKICLLVAITSSELCCRSPFIRLHSSVSRPSLYVRVCVVCVYVCVWCVYVYLRVCVCVYVCLFGDIQQCMHANRTNVGVVDSRRTTYNSGYF